MTNGHLKAGHMDFEADAYAPGHVNGAAMKNGRPIPTVNGLAFEGASRVQMTNFDHEEADREFIEEQREIGRKEAMMDPLRLLVEGLDRVIADPNPGLAAECYKYVCGLSESTEVEIARRRGVKKSAVSKRVKQLQQLIGDLGLPPAAAMRTEKACKSFVEATSKKWKQRPQKVHRSNPLQIPVQA